jgi:hypothetical protein
VPLLPVLRTRRIVLGHDATDPYYLLDRDLSPYYVLGNRYDNCHNNNATKRGSQTIGGPRAGSKTL